MATSCPGDAFPWDELLKRLEDKQLEPITIKIGDKVLDGQREGENPVIGPVRDMLEAVGCTVDYDDATKTVTITPPDPCANCPKLAESVIERGKLFAEATQLRQIISQASGVLSRAN
jgi:hypothetical protein